MARETGAQGTMPTFRVRHNAQAVLISSA